MKKNKRANTKLKLSLHLETIRQLNDFSLPKVNGALFDPSTHPWCSHVGCTEPV
jgi:hypothetical protein